MILYLFYNADLLENMGKSEVKVRYIDDINFYAKGSMFEDAYARIWDMMTRANSGQDWLMNHNSIYELSKLKLVGFSRCQVPNPGCPGKTMLEQCPDLTLQGTHIKPSGS